MAEMPAAQPETRSTHGLRRWPAVVLLLAMPLIRGLPKLFESPDLSLLMVGFMGPAVLGLLILFWWCLASRASGKEKLVGLVGFLVIAGVGVAIIHPTLKGMGVVINMAPTALAAFGLGLVLFAKQPKWRVPMGLLLTILGVGFWDLQQSEGVTGDFSPQLLWRWQPNAEQQYLNELEVRGEAQPSLSNEAAITAASSPWPAFRGSQRDGVVGGVSLSEDWTSSPPREVWRRKIGPGWSSFSVGGQRLFTQEQRGDEEAVVCLSAETGETLWDHTYPSRFWEAIGGAGPRGTPTIADEGLFSLGADGILLCLDPTTGTQKWSRDLKVDAERGPPTWGFSASPLVTDGLVLVHAGGDGDKGLFAYAVADGSVVWSVPSGNHTYSSPHPATIHGVRGILMMTNDALQFVNVSDGQTIWQHDWSTENYRALQPLVLESSILIATGLGNGTRRITVTQDDAGAWSITEDWTSRDMKPDYNDFVRFEDAVYGFDGSIFACIDLVRGERQWKRGRYGNGQVLLLGDSGQLLVTSEKGEIVLVQATPEKLDERARFQAIEGKTWNHSVLIQDRLYMRNAEEAACYRMPLVSAN